ncbi:MAG: 50S ribosome-binding GTPase [Candidatus Aenigmarchaeota archaeon]|nr:50S ribosome-binding GTPase [Candidatus Aenigmarchaeota archaeon]
MPVNPPAEYYLAEEKFRNAKNKEDKIIAMEEMIRQMPKHHGSEKALADLKSKLAKLKKESAASSKKGKGGSKFNVHKEGEAQACLIGFTNSGKSWLLNKLTGSKASVSGHPYTTTKPEVGMMDYKGVKIQIVEIPGTFEREHMAIARTAELIVFVVGEAGEELKLEGILKGNFIATRRIEVNPWKESPDQIKENIWKSLDMMIVYTKKKAHNDYKTPATSPMAMPVGGTIRDFTQRIHKDFERNFRFARVSTTDKKGRQLMKQVGLDYKLKNGDIVELHTT